VETRKKEFSEEVSSLKTAIKAATDASSNTFGPYGGYGYRKPQKPVQVDEISPYSLGSLTREISEAWKNPKPPPAPADSEKDKKPESDAKAA